ncbi:RDD family protein [Aquibacillus rhizosphaerae]|uniref:RDD family protein n=1 Tax=Aquibacillus rhizosphaerae TaxID=3051431 RepID=A0ABT7L4Y8_9BACI|nr:RDD family protein [Aquibacillus sp. LR5S19]MDL4840247.1 RDD family protein [Aquibacillus sp. LR5S19]
MDITSPAGFQNRFLARILDLIIIFLVTGVISKILYGVFYDGDNYYSIDFFGLFYGLLLPIFWYGYTLGRRMVGNRIVRIDGKKVGIGTMLLRDIIAGIFYLLTLGIGLIVSAFMIGIREDKRAIHDFIARTFVTTEPPSNP